METCIAFDTAHTVPGNVPVRPEKPSMSPDITIGIQVTLPVAPEMGCHAQVTAMGMGAIWAGCRMG